MANAPASPRRYNAPVSLLDKLLPPLQRDRIRPAYVLVGDEIFFRDRFRQALLQLLVPQEMHGYCVFEEDLSTTGLDDILDRARNSSLMAPVQIFFIRNVKDLFGRGGGSGDAPKKKGSRRKHGDFPNNLHGYLKDANPNSVLVFIADHLRVPVDQRRISLDDKSKLKRIEETLGAGKGVETFLCARVAEAQGVEIARQLAGEQNMKIEPDAARLLLELLDGDLGMTSAELGKLCCFAQQEGVVRKQDVEMMVSANRQRSAYDLARALALRDRVRALQVLETMWDAEGDALGIPLIFQLARIFKMAVLLKERGIRDRGQLYSVLPDGLKPPTFAADDILAVSERMPLRTLLRALELLQKADVWLRSSPLSARLVMEQVLFDLTTAPAPLNPWRQQTLSAAL